MSRAFARGSAIATLLLAMSSPAWADRVAVKVIEVGANIAYVEPGRAAGVVPGTKVQVGSHEFTVLEATDKNAAITLGSEALAVGASGNADVVAGAQINGAKKLSTPRAFGEWKDQWNAPVLPAATQTTKVVPLGSGRAPGQVHLAVLESSYGAIDKNGIDGQAEVRVVSSFNVMTDRPLAADIDVGVRGFTSGWNTGSNVPLFVRAAQLRYGDANDPSLAIGRLRYAASSVGMLDGGRVAAHLGSFEIAAFGGLVPDPVSGAPTSSASRFGVEAMYDASTSAWQPRVGVTVHGSTWNSSLDERTLSVFASANHQSTFLSGWADVQSFAAGNPFGAPSIEVTGAGLSADWRHDGFHAGADLTFLRPEQSLRLLAALPAEWLCTRVPQRGDVPNEACASGDAWSAASASAGFRRGIWSVDMMGTIGTTTGVVDTVNMSGYLRTELHLGHQRLELGASGGRASVERWVSGDVGFGTSPSQRYDLAIRYRPELLDYSAATGAYLMHSLSLDLRYSASAALDLGVSAIGTTGVDRDALVLLTTIAWRPRP